MSYRRRFTPYVIAGSIVAVGAIGASIVFSSLGDESSLRTADDRQSVTSTTAQSAFTPKVVEGYAFGATRDAAACDITGETHIDPGRILHTVNGVDPAPASFVVDLDKSTIPLWESESVAWTGASTDRLHLIGMGKDGVGLANPQLLAPPSEPARMEHGLWASGEYRKFGEEHFLSSQLPYATQAAPLAGTINSGYAVWIEQLVSQSSNNASEYAWRIMSAPTQPGAPVTEMESSWSLTRREVLPAVTPWRPPVTDGHRVFYEVHLPGEDEESPDEFVVMSTSLQTPGDSQKIGRGRLPITVGEEMAWVDDTANYGLDTENDVFTVNWLDDTHEPLVLYTGDYMKLQWLEGNRDYLIVVLQDTCTARSAIGRYDRNQKLFTGWALSKADRTAASLNDNILVWGNGSGTVGSSMYRWDLSTDIVEKLGNTEGYSLPFSGGNSGVAVSQFRGVGTTPLVSWDFRAQ